MADLIYKDESYAIIGAAIEVYNQLGPGFLEAVYQEAFQMELSTRTIPFNPQQELILRYKNRPLNTFYIPDFVAYGKIIVEIKAMAALSDIEAAQVINYIKATGFELGILINFGNAEKLEHKRFVRSRKLGAIKLETPR